MKRNLPNTSSMLQDQMNQTTTQYIQKQMKELPDLPALESAELKNWKGLLFGGLYLCMILGMLAFPIYGCIKLWKYLDQRAVISLGLLGALILWILLRSLFADLYWKTDSQGITIKGILRRRFIRWNEVRRAYSTKSTVTKRLVYKLQTDQGMVDIPEREDSSLYNGRELAASVWRHLRHTGKVDNLVLSKETLSLWDDIPDNLPRNIQWNGRSRRSDAIGGAVMAILFTSLFAGMTFGEPRLVLMFIGCVPAAFFIARMFYREAYLVSESISLTDEHIEARTLRKTITLYWSEVTRIYWDRHDLIISSTNPRKQIWIEYEHTETANDQGKLILAVLRRLRELNPPFYMTIPEVLRAKQISEDKITNNQVQIQSDIAKLTPTIAERITGALCLSIMLSLLLMVIYAATKSTMLTVITGVFIYFFGFFAIGTYKYRGDKNTIEKQFMWWKRTIHLTDVAKFDHWLTAKSHYKKWILRDSSGKKLIDITLDTGSKKDKVIFEAYLLQRLSEVVPQEPNNWLSRPRFFLSDEA